ncbi:hypothetical protein LJR296_001424 [Cupriavidus necator]|uniref:hypothetical protein n=1 Tax=Cupriavidus necator TaxID=106590 RepID=UPI003ECE2972
MMYDPARIEAERRRPVSTIPYAGQHNTFRCTSCKGNFNRALRLKDGKLNVCPSCKEARVAKAAGVQ